MTPEVEFVAVGWDVDPTHEPTAEWSPAADRWHDLRMKAGLVGPEAPVTVTFGEAA